MIKKICNMCGKEFDMWDEQESFGIYNYNVGYGSKYDGDIIRLDLCCECADKIIDACKISPVEERTISQVGGVYNGRHLTRTDEDIPPF